MMNMHASNDNVKNTLLTEHLSLTTTTECTLSASTVAQLAHMLRQKTSYDKFKILKSYKMFLSHTKVK